MMQAVRSLIADSSRRASIWKVSRIGVDEDGQRVVDQDRVDRGHERVGRDEDLVARPDPERGQGGDQRARAVGDGHAMLGTHHPTPGLLEPVRVVAVDTAPSPLSENLHPGPFVVLGDDRPPGEFLATDRLPAQDRQRLVDPGGRAPIRQSDRRRGRRHGAEKTSPRMGHSQPLSDFGLEHPGRRFGCSIGIAHSCLIGAT